MMQNANMRFDHTIADDGALVAIWGIHGGCELSLAREHIASVYSIPAGGKRYRPDANYEFSLFMLSPVVAINFNRSMFCQKDLRPIVPAAFKFQMYARDHASVISSTRRFVEFIARFEIDIDFSTISRLMADVPEVIIVDEHSKPLISAA